MRCPISCSVVALRSRMRSGQGLCTDDGQQLQLLVALTAGFGRVDEQTVGLVRV